MEIEDSFLPECHYCKWRGDHYWYAASITDEQRRKHKNTKFYPTNGYVRPDLALCETCEQEIKHPESPKSDKIKTALFQRGRQTWFR